jgi:alcohol dehydrogenase
VIAIDIRDEALALARDLGAEAVLRADRTDAAAAVRELTGGGAHLSVDALGSAESCRASLRSLRKRGRHVQVGLLLADERSPSIPMELVIARELEIYGSHGMPASRYEALFERVAEGRFDPGRLVTKRIALDEAGDELAAMGDFGQRGVTVIDRF